MSPGLTSPEFPAGSVRPVGAGPGDPRLPTLHAAHALKHADVVLYDALVIPEILTLGDGAIGASGPARLKIRCAWRLVAEGG